MTNAFSKFSKPTQFEMLFTKESISKNEENPYEEKVLKLYGLSNTRKTQEAMVWMRKTILSWIVDGDLDKTFMFETINDTLTTAGDWTKKYRFLMSHMLYEYSIYNDGRGPAEFLTELEEAGYEFSSIVKVNKPTSPFSQYYTGAYNGTTKHGLIISHLGLFTPEEMVQKDKVIEQKMYENKRKAEIQEKVDAELAKRNEKLEFPIAQRNEKAGLKTCFCGCGEQALKMMRPASKCGARYVNAEHQLNAWKEHKANCEICFLYSQNEKAKQAERNLD